MAKESPRDPTRFRRLFAILSAAIIVVVLVLALVVIKPAIPDRIVLLTGPESGAYHEFGTRLAEDLKARGIDMDVVVTGGSLDNLDRLGESEDAVALAPSIVDWKSKFGDSPPLVALGSVGIEPLWLFYRAELTVNRLSDLSGKALATEGRDTTSYQVAKRLVKEVGLEGQMKIVPLSDRVGAQSIAGFATGELDAVFLSGQVHSRVVQSLLKSDRAKLLSLHRGKAMAKRISGATVIVAPEGVFDLARNLPENDTQLLSGMTCLVAGKDVHAAVVPMLLSAVENIGAENSSFISTSRFPSSEHVTLPLAPASQRYFRQGQVGLSKYLPYHMVRFLNHLGFLVLPLLTVVVVLLKAVPMGLRMIGGVQIKRLFRQLESIERAHAAGTDPAKLIEQLDEIDQTTATMFVPRSIAQEYVDFRQFLHDMRDRIRDHREA